MRATTMDKQLLLQISEMAVILWDETQKQKRSTKTAALKKAAKQQNDNTKASRGGPAHSGYKKGQL